MIKAIVNDQDMHLQYEDVASDSVNYLCIKFECDSESDWKHAVKTAFFSDNTGVREGVVMLDGNPMYLGNDTCIVPSSVLHGEAFTVTLLGETGARGITTNICEVALNDSGYNRDDEMLTPDFSVFEQILLSTRKALSVAQSVRDDADNGVFDGADGTDGAKGDKGDKGDNGDKGDPGEKGDKGEKGDQGEPGRDAVVDQSYDPESENAQSGVAMASVIGDIETLLNALR